MLYSDLSCIFGYGQTQNRIKMRIAIDAHAIGHNLAGNGIYTFNLICNLVRCFPLHDWFLYITDTGKEKLPEDVLKASKVRILKSKTPIYRYAIEMPRLISKDKPDVFHFQYQGPLWCNCPMVNTVHDISYDRLPEYFTLDDRVRMKLLCPYFMKRSKKILTVSHFSRKEIIKRYGFDENKVLTAYNGVDRDLFFHDKSRDDTKKLKLLGIEDSYLLFVGSLQPRKNIEGVLIALATGVITKYPELKMVIAGPKGWLSGGIDKVIKKYPFLKRLAIFLGHVEDETLRILYNNCIAVTYVPFYEGFGLPVVEAMACGAPVIASNVTSLPEIGGDAVRYVDPYNIQGMADAICNVLSSQSVRHTMIEKGLKQAKKFSWKTTAKTTCRIFEELVS